MRLPGWRVVYEPSAVVDVHSGTGAEWSPMFSFHVDRNRLFMILKIAPAGFALRAFTWYGWLAAHDEARALMRRKDALDHPRKKRRMRPGARLHVHLRVVASLVRYLATMLSNRRNIRRTRFIADADISRWFYRRARDDR